FAALALAVVGSDGSVAGIAASSLAATAIYGVGIVAASHRAGLWPMAGGSARDEVRAGLPLIALRITGVGYRQLDKLALGALVGVVATAGFDVAEKANLVALTLLGVATSALIPAAAHALRRGPDGASRLALDATKWSALAAAPVAGIVIGLAGPLSDVIAGSHLPGVPAAIRWLALTTIVACVYAAAFEMSIGAGAARKLVPFSVAGLVINVGATLVLVRAYGLPGSAAASFIATATVAPWVTRITAEAVGQRVRALVLIVLPALGVASVAAAGSWWAAGSGEGFGALLRGGFVGGVVWAVGAAIVARRSDLPPFPRRRRGTPDSVATHA
ncbi:MAG: hypothetical protein QOD63_718, partial [Actinomycetota bacterium]|nr:hypothetical protein [Actinomycetota bacterium]